jgi:inner membrane transporter RhtA
MRTTSSLPQSTVRFRPPAAALVVTSSVSGQCGAAVATKLFDQVGPAGTLTLRLVFAAIALAALARPWRHDVRGILHPSRRSDLAVVVLFGLVLAGMNLSFYESIARIPLGVAVTVEFVGPLTVSVVGSRRWTDGLWALLAGAGVLLLASGSIFGVLHHLDVAGVGFAALAGCFWATYILLNKETGKRFNGTTGLAGAMAVGALFVAPIGAVHAEAALLHPAVLGVGAAVALLSSVIPYSCELAALRRATPRAFGILLSMAPALAALAGFAILAQRLSALEVGALVLVVAANLGSSWLGTRTLTAGVDVATRGTDDPGRLDPGRLDPGRLDPGAPVPGAPVPGAPAFTPAGSAPLPASPQPTVRR